jgi:hypothetical protein
MRFRYALQPLLDVARAQERAARARLVLARRALAAAARAPLPGGAARDFALWAQHDALLRAAADRAVRTWTACERKAGALERHRALRVRAHELARALRAERELDESNALLRQFDREHEGAECAIGARAIAGGEEVEE